MTLRISEFRDLLDTALSILGSGAGRVEMVEGNRRVRVGRLAGVPGMSPETDLGVRPTGELRAAPLGGMMVRAPAIGVVTFRDNRTDRPLVEIGQRIERGQTLAFIGALDVTTKVVSPVSGVVEEVFVDDGDGVEFDAPLLKLLPTE